MNEAQEYYRATAVYFAEQINKIFESEESLKALFESYFPGLPFDRTDHWNGILNREVTKAWQIAGPTVITVPTSTDIYKILQELRKLLDYNIFTQVALNLQNFAGWAYQAKDAEKELEVLKRKWADYQELNGKNLTPNPLEPKAKMIKAAASDIDFEHNADLSAIKALRIITQFGPLSSFRVSPKGSTPAFADSKNLSMIGLGGDRYLKTIPGLKIFYITWSDAPNLLLPQEDGSFKTAEIPYNFISKSGGQILNEVLFSRWLAYRVYGVIDMTTKMLTVIPRMNSVMIVASQHVPELETLVKEIQAAYKISLHEGVRPNQLEAASAG
jgi:hypothetical protein